MTAPPATDGSRFPQILGYSLALGLVYCTAWLGYTAVRARDGRMPSTDWLDPMLAGATLLVTLSAIAVLIVLWPRMPVARPRSAAATLLVTAEWMYVTGEVVSNTLTIGEPPSDIGGLLEIASGAVTLLGLIAIVVALYGPAWGQNRRATTGVTATAVLLAFGMGWWFTHPIDQSTPGTPGCVPGNALYNAVHGTTC
jgi:hypothetical protein